MDRPRASARAEGPRYVHNAGTHSGRSLDRSAGACGATGEPRLSSSLSSHSSSSAGAAALRLGAAGLGAARPRWRATSRRDVSTLESKAGVVRVCAFLRPAGAKARQRGGLRTWEARRACSRRGPPRRATCCSRRCACAAARATSQPPASPAPRTCSARRSGHNKRSVACAAVGALKAAATHPQPLAQLLDFVRRFHLGVLRGARHGARAAHEARLPDTLPGGAQLLLEFRLS